MANSEIYSAHYISGTHWDREWYRTYQEFRLLFVDLVDGLLDLMEKNPAFKSFHFDGQTCVLQDYLEVRPENRDRLAALIRSGRILIGPWYTMPDLFCPGAEALVRNLLTGQRIASAWSTSAMPVAYTCDMFGHPSQMPQIYQGFGISSCVLGRGTNEYDTPAFFHWQSPDGSKVLCFKLQDKMGYGAFNKARQEFERGDGSEESHERARKSLQDYIEHEISRSNGRVLCLIDALDHMPPASDAAKYITVAETACAQVRVSHSTLPAFFADAAAHLDGDIPVKRGELRDPAKTRNGYLWLIPNCVSSRIRLKQANDACQALLELQAEPLLAIAQSLGISVVPPRLPQIAWETLLLNHAHDSICGCSIDEVHRDMMYRFDQVEQLGRQIRNRALGMISSRCRELGTAPHEFTLTVCNCVPRPWTGSSVIDIDFPLDWPNKLCDAFHSQVLNAFILEDADGRRVPYQILAVEPRHAERTQYAVMGWNATGTPCSRYTVAVDLDIPATGFRSLVVKPVASLQRSMGSLRNGPCSAENEHLAMSIAANGTIELRDKASGQIYSDLMLFEDRSEIGDGWFHGQSASDEIALSAGNSAQISVVHDGPLAVTFRIQTTMDLPERYDFHLERRSESRRGLTIVTTVTLRRGARALECHSEIRNNIEDHRLRLLFPSDAVAAQSWLAHHPYDLVERPIRLRRETADWSEADLAEKPFLHLQAVGDGSRGLALIVPGGMHEGGVVDDARRTLQMTLFRSYRRTVGSTAGRDGLELCPLHVAFAIMPYAGELPVAAAFDQLFAMQSPLVLRQSGKCRSGYPELTGDQAPDQGFMELLDGQLIFSACKNAEDGRGVIVRLWNPHAQPAQERLRLWQDIASANGCDLAERDGEALAAEGREVVVSAEAKQIRTIRIQFKD